MIELRQLAIAPYNNIRSPLLGLIMLDADYRPVVASDGSQWLAGPVDPGSSSSYSIEGWYYQQVSAELPKAAVFGRVWCISGDGIVYDFAGGGPINAGASNGLERAGTIPAAFPNGHPNLLLAGHMLDLTGDWPRPFLMPPVYNPPTTGARENTVGTAVRRLGATGDWSGGTSEFIEYRRRVRVTNSSIASNLYVAAHFIEDEASVSTDAFDYALGPGEHLMLDLQPFFGLGAVRAAGAASGRVVFEEWVHGIVV
jgi:hypothetical protein